MTHLKLKELSDFFHMTTIMVTHDKEDAFSMSNRIATLLYGKIQYVGTPQQYFHKTNNSCVDAYIGDIILLEDNRIVFQDKIIKI